GQPLVLGLVYHTTTHTNIVNADNLCASRVCPNVPNGFGRRCVLPRLQRVYVTARDNAAHALCVTVASDVNTCYLAAARANLVPPFPCRLHPRQGNERIVARRRELAKHAAIPHGAIFTPFLAALLNP